MGEAIWTQRPRFPSLQPPLLSAERYDLSSKSWVCLLVGHVQNILPWRLPGSILVRCLNHLSCWIVSEIYYYPKIVSETLNCQAKPQQTGGLNPPVGWNLFVESACCRCACVGSVSELRNFSHDPKPGMFDWLVTLNRRSLGSNHQSSKW